MNHIIAIDALPYVGSLLNWRALSRCNPAASHVKRNVRVEIMSFSEFELKRYNKLVGDYVESCRPPPHVRPQLDIGYRIKGQSVEIFEIRPRWDNRKEKMEEAVAKATYVKRQNLWKIYWQRQDLKWHRYEPVPEVESLDEFLVIVANDKYGCFFG